MTNYEQGFMNKCAEHGVPADVAGQMLNRIGTMGKSAQMYAQHPASYDPRGYNKPTAKSTRRLIEGLGLSGWGNTSTNNTSLPKLTHPASYDPMYGTQHQIGSLSDNIDALRNWIAGKGLAMQTAYSTHVQNDELQHDMSSISAPTLVDRAHGWWDGVRGRGNPYGTTDMGSDISPQQFDANIQNARIPSGGWLRQVQPGEYDGSWTQHDDGSFSKGNTRSYPIDGQALYNMLYKHQ